MTDRMAGPLAGRSALVTGGSRGIGLAIARRLGGAGARLVLLARGREALREAARLVGGDPLVVPCDVARPDEVERAASTVAAALAGPPDVLINNAGLFRLQRVEETAPVDFVRTLETNLVAPFLFARAFVPGMRARGRGHVVTIGSIADRAVFPENGAYAASKFGLRALHEAMRAELRGSGVRASLVSPGPVDTPLWDPHDPDTRAGFTPRAAMLAPEAVADAVHYVVTAPASLNVDELRLSRT